MTTGLVNDEAFDVLCELAAGDNLICMTGAGTSAGLLRSGGREKLPGWLALLKEVRGRMSSGQPAGLARPLPLADIDALLYEGATGPHLIEAASLLRAGREDEFDRQVKEVLTPAEDQLETTRRMHEERQDALLDLCPRGIVTFNVDREHEKALRRRGLDWEVLNPLTQDGEQKLGEACRDRLARRFLLKAHGTLDEAGGIVFTFDAYRDLLERNPAYRAFVQNLFTNFSFLFVGFGMSDLDFDLFIQTMAMQFGSPLQRHVVVRRKPSKEKDEADLPFAQRAAREQGLAVAIRRRFGIHTLLVEDWPDIPKVLDRARRTISPSLRKIEALCLNHDDNDDRSLGHERLRALGTSGKTVMSNYLMDRIEKDAGKLSVADRSELVYSLGVIPFDRGAEGWSRIKAFLFKILKNADSREILAHALSVIEPFLEWSDLPVLEEVGRKLVKQPPPNDPDHPDPDNRLPVYVERLILRLRAGRREFPRRPDGPLVKVVGS